MVDDLRSALFDDHATVHEDDLVGDLAGEPDLMGDDTMVMPSLARSSMTLSTSPTSSGSSADVGSSNSMISGFMASARAMATRCC